MQYFVLISEPAIILRRDNLKTGKRIARYVIEADSLNEAVKAVDGISERLGLRRRGSSLEWTDAEDNLYTITYSLPLIQASAILAKSV